MSLRVNTNVASLTAQRNLATVTNRLQGNFARLSSGLRIATAADDAAGLGVSERMRAQIRGFGVAYRNAQDGISMAETAEGALQEVSNMLVRMRELAVQAANGTLSAGDRTVINTEYQALLAEIDRTAGEATFNGVVLLNGTTASAAIQVGIDAGDTISLTLPDTRSATLLINTSSVTSVANANTAMGLLDTAINTVSTARGTLGAQQNRINSTIATVLNIRENMSAAESRIRDVDIAAETADLTRNTILQQASIAVLAQANVQPQLALELLRG